jgi:hypothetical protein
VYIAGGVAGALGAAGAAGATGRVPPGGTSNCLPGRITLVRDSLLTLRDQRGDTQAAGDAQQGVALQHGVDSQGRPGVLGSDPPAGTANCIPGRMRLRW